MFNGKLLLLMCEQLILLEEFNWSTENIYREHEQMAKTWWLDQLSMRCQSLRKSCYTHEFLMNNSRKSRKSRAFCWCLPCNWSLELVLPLVYAAMSVSPEDISHKGIQLLSIVHHHPSSHFFLYANSSRPLIQLLSFFCHLTLIHLLTQHQRIVFICSVLFSSFALSCAWDGWLW